MPIYSPAVSAAVLLTIWVFCFPVTIYCLYLVRRLNRAHRRNMRSLSAFGTAVRSGSVVRVSVPDLLIIAQSENFTYGK